MTHAVGFEPAFDGQSKLLVLGSFPSVKSREISFYYGHKQNAFWRTLCSFFGESVPQTVEGKCDFLRRRKIALWDMITECDIVGSSDASIRNEQVAHLPTLLENSAITAIFCNGIKSFSLLQKYFPQYLPITKKLSSTSPANPRFRAEEWHAALSEVFEGGRV